MEAIEAEAVAEAEGVSEAEGGEVGAVAEEELCGVLLVVVMVAGGLVQRGAPMPILLAPSVPESIPKLPRVLLDLGAGPGGLGEERASDAEECVVRAILKRRGSCGVVLLCACCCCCWDCCVWLVAAPNGRESLKLEGVGAGVDAAPLLAPPLPLPPPLPPLPKVNGEVGVLMCEERLEEEKPRFIPSMALEGVSIPSAWRVVDAGPPSSALMLPRRD